MKNLVSRLCLGLIAKDRASRASPKVDSASAWATWVDGRRSNREGRVQAIHTSFSFEQEKIPFHPVNHCDWTVKKKDRKIGQSPISRLGTIPIATACLTTANKIQLFCSTLAQGRAEDLTHATSFVECPYGPSPAPMFDRPKGPYTGTVAWANSSIDVKLRHLQCHRFFGNSLLPCLGTWILQPRILYFFSFSTIPGAVCWVLFWSIVLVPWSIGGGGVA